MALTLDVRLNGFAEPIGQLSSTDRGAVAFAYGEDYLRQHEVVPLSLSLPLDGSPFGDVATRAFFDNLLQERGTARADIAARYGLDNDDIVGILYHLGRDCTGAVSVLPEGAPPVKVPGDLSRDYRPYEDAEIAAIVRLMHEQQRLPRETRDPSPLAGVQSKIAVTRLPDGRLAEPIVDTGAPTTHILKVPDRRHPRDARIEHRAMLLSADFGLPTAKTEVIEVDGIAALLVERFDRRIDEEGLILRRHQEDFCQALGLPSRLKYERDGTPGRHFGATTVRRVLDGTIDPIDERGRFIEITLFDILIGNVDGHAKNFSLFHLPGNRLLTTPRYDVLPTMLDRQTTDEFAYRLGAATDLRHLTPDDLATFLVDLGLNAKPARRLSNAIMQNTVAFLDGQLEEIEETGSKDFADLVATNIRTLAHNFDFAPPPHAVGRDTFVR